MTAACSLALNQLRLPVFLGVYPEEKLEKFPINIDLYIRFLSPPPGCVSDKLDDTYCYGKIIAHIKDGLDDRRFKLIEYLAQEIHGLMKGYFPPETLITVRVTKMPKIPELTQGASFVYGDEKTACSF